MTTFGNLIGYLVWVFSGNFLLLLVGRLINGFAAGNISTLTAAATDLSTQKSVPALWVPLVQHSAPVLCLALRSAALPLPRFLIWMVYCGGLTAFPPSPLFQRSLAVFNILLILKFFPETLRKGDGSAVKNVPLSSIKALKPLSLAYFIFMVSFTAMELALIFMVEELLAFRPGDISWLFVSIGLTSIIVQGGLVRRMSGRINDKTFTIAGLVLFTSGMLLLASIASFPWAGLPLWGRLSFPWGLPVFSPQQPPGCLSWPRMTNRAQPWGVFEVSERLLESLARLVVQGSILLLAPQPPLWFSRHF